MYKIATVKLIRNVKFIINIQVKVQSRSQQNDGNVTFALVIVVIVFIACQVPTFVWYVIYEVIPDGGNYCSGILFYPQRIVDMLVTFNSSINFVIYHIANKAFRDVLVEKVFGRRTKIPVVTHHEMDNTALRETV